MSTQWNSLRRKAAATIIPAAVTGDREILRRRGIRRIGSHTSDDLLLLRLAMALKARHEPATAQINILKEHAAAARVLNVTLHLREEALLNLTLLNDPNTALQLAVQNWKIQREPADARILLAAAAATGQSTAAEPVLTWMKE